MEISDLVWQIDLCQERVIRQLETAGLNLLLLKARRMKISSRFDSVSPEMMVMSRNWSQ